MKRDELIAKISQRCSEQIASRRSLDKSIMELIRRAFVFGTMWADAHPKNVWHDPEEEPKDAKGLLLIDTKGCLWVGFVSHTKGSPAWKTYVQKGKVAKWAYVEELLPKIDE